MERKTILRVTTVICLALLITGCGSSSQSTPELAFEPADIKSITYEFDDTTLPVEDQRSYQITAEQDRVNIAIENHEGLYMDETYEITEERFTFVKNALQRNLIRNCALSSEAQCQNGIMESISYSTDKGEVFYGTVYNCNERITGNLCGDYKTFSNRMKELIPQFQQLLNMDPEPQ